MIEGALRLHPKGGLRPWTYATLIALLSVTGLRISEALKLTVADVTRDGLLIRETKFRKTRLTPLHDTAAAGLERYLVRRRPCSEADPVFVDARGLPLRYIAVKETFDRLVGRTGIASGRDAARVCTICGTRSRCARCRAVLPIEAEPARILRRSRPTWVTSTSTRPTGTSRPPPTSCATSPRPARRSSPKGGSHDADCSPHRSVPRRDARASSGLSRHTRDSYAVSFQLLFVFAAKRLKVSPSALTLEQLDAGLISAFLEHLEDERENAPVTRNVRLAAIKSFFRFLEYRQPAALEHIRRVLAIPFKKTDQRLVPYLLREELQAVLDAPDPATRDGIRDRAMLHLAVCAGLRVSELTGLKLNDVDLSSMSIRVLGKGRRERTLPLWKATAAALRAWLALRGRIAAPEVFVNARGEPMSRWGFAYLLKQHAAAAARTHPGLDKKRISPHVLRHTCAMIILQATQDIRKVSLWLGHATLTTTEIYTRGDPTEKLDAMELIVPPHLRRGFVPAVRQAARAPQAPLVMESRIGGGGRESGTKSSPTPHY